MAGPRQDAGHRDPLGPDAVLLEPVRLRPTRRMLLVPTLGLLLFAAGQNIGAGYLLVLAGTLIAAAPWAWWSTRRAARTIRVRRELPSSATSGEAVAVVLHVHAESAGALVLRDELLGTVGVVDDPRDGDRLRAVVELARGAAADGEVTVEVSDALGLVRATATGRVPGRIEVAPPTLRADVRGVAATAGRRAEQQQRLAGDGAQTDGTREYRHGDPVRAVHWRSSARRDELVVRRLVGEATGRLRVELARGAWDRASLDVACLAAVATADGAAELGVDVEVAVGDHVLPWSPVHGRRLLAHLRPNLGHATGDGSPDREAPGLASARPLGEARDPHVAVRLAPHGDVVGVALVVEGTSRPLGRLSSTAGTSEVRAWVAEHLGGLGASTAGGAGDRGAAVAG